MKIAIISDIHGNIEALKVVLKDIKERGIIQIYSTGDLVEYLPFPNEVIDALRTAEVISIMGNHDLAVLESQLPSDEERAKMTDEEIQSKGSNIFTLETMTQVNVAYIAELPRTIVIDIGSRTIRLVHGRPNDINGYIRENCEDFESIAREFEEDILVSGHSHEPFHKEIYGKHFVNAGSVGFPKHGVPKGTYVILDVEDNYFEVDVIEVDYEKSLLIDTIKADSRISDALITRLVEGK